MESPIARIQKRMMEVIQQELQQWLASVLKGTFSPEKMMRFLRTMGIDISQLPSMVSQQNLDPYQVLGLDKSASDEEVKQAYRKVMSQVHPDKAGPELTTLAAIVNAAYQYICRERGTT